MEASNGQGAGSDGEPSLPPPTTTVVVPTGGGERFHRPDGLGFETACKTRFGQPVRKMPLIRAAREGFTPCVKLACFGDAVD